MHFGTIWLVPLAAAGAGAGVLAGTAWWLAGEVERLKRAVRPLRATTLPKPDRRSK